MHAPRKLGPVALAATALALLLAGCSGSGSDDGATTTSTVASTTTVAPPASTTTEPSTTTTEGGGTGAEGSEITADPCTLLSDAEIEAIGGNGDVAKPDEFNGVFPGCNFGIVTLYVNVNPSYLPDDGTPVSGIGDGATYDESLHRLFFEAEGSVLLVTCVVCESDADELDVLSGLAEDVIAKL